jgi:Glycosyltransferase family 87
MAESTINTKCCGIVTGSLRYGSDTPKPIFILVIAFTVVWGLIFAWVYVDALVIMPADGKRLNSATNGVGGDFVLPYAAALLALEGAPEEAFDVAKIHEIEKQVSKNSSMPSIPWPYPPFFQLLIMPLGILNYITAYRVYVIITLAMATIVAWCIAPHWYMPLLLVIFPAVAFCAAVGQNGNLSAAFIGAGLLWLKRRPIASGVAFGLMAYKPHLAIAIPLCLLAGRHYRALAATVCAALATVLISVVTLGSKPLIAFLLNLASHGRMTLDHQIDIWQRMPTILVLVLQLSDSKTYALIAQIFVAVAALGGAAWVWRRAFLEGHKALALAASIPLTTPYFVDYDMAIFAIPFVYLVWESWRMGFTYHRALIIATLWLAPPVIFLIPYWVTTPWQIGPIVWVFLLGNVVYQVVRHKPGFDDHRHTLCEIPK